MIELMLVEGHWMARYSGELKREIEALFQTDTLPTAFCDKMPRERVIDELQKRNPDITIL